jgi:hypothetical protein
MNDLEYKLDWIGGNCPVQAEGTYQGKNFYFRARGTSWAFYIGNGDPYIDPIWHYSERYGDEPFGAGWMEEAEALGFIEKSIRLYNESLKGA